MFFFRKNKRNRKSRQIIRLKKKISSPTLLTETNSSNYTDESDNTTTTSQNSSSSIQHCRNIPEITLELGGIISKFMPDGSWIPRTCHENDTQKDKLLRVKTKNDKLLKEKEKLRLKFDVLFDLAKNTTVEYQDAKEELEKLKQILKNAPSRKEISYKIQPELQFCV